MTIPHSPPARRKGHRCDPNALALTALGWVLEDSDRAQRLLSLTGLTPEILREGLDQPRVLGAVLEFLTNHEPDLIACAQATECQPADLVHAHQELAQ